MPLWVQNGGLWIQNGGIVADGSCCPEFVGWRAMKFKLSGLSQCWSTIEAELPRWLPGWNTQPWVMEYDLSGLYGKEARMWPTFVNPGLGSSVTVDFNLPIGITYIRKSDMTRFGPYYNASLLDTFLANNAGVTSGQTVLRVMMGNHFNLQSIFEGRSPNETQCGMTYPKIYRTQVGSSIPYQNLMACYPAGQNPADWEGYFPASGGIADMTPIMSKIDQFNVSFSDPGSGTDLGYSNFPYYSLTASAQTVAASFTFLRQPQSGASREFPDDRWIACKGAYGDWGLWPVHGSTADLPGTPNPGRYSTEFDVPWITLNSFDGSGDGQVVISVQANTTGGTRAGGFFVNEQKFALFQNG